MSSESPHEHRPVAKGIWHHARRQTFPTGSSPMHFARAVLSVMALQAKGSHISTYTCDDNSTEEVHRCIAQSWMKCFICSEEHYGCMHDTAASIIGVAI